MITIHIPESKDMWDPIKEEFIDGPAYTLQLEHSLISLQIWESRWEKPFLETNKTEDEMLDYIRCMTINKGIPDEAYNRIPASEMQRISDYIKAPMTATKIYSFGSSPKKSKKPQRKRTMTAEQLYYYMISYNIPSEYRKWHLNQLITLIQVFNVENDDGNKMSRTDAAAWQKAENERRRLKHHTKG